MLPLLLSFGVIQCELLSMLPLLLSFGVIQCEILSFESYHLDWEMSQSEVTFHLTQKHRVSASSALEAYKKLPKRWFAIALHPSRMTMIKTDILMAYLNESPSCTWSDRWSNSGIEMFIIGKETYENNGKGPYLDTQLGGVDDLIGLPIYVNYNDSMITVTCSVKRKLNTGDPNDLVITDSTISLTLGYGELVNSTLKKHSKSLSNFNVNLFDGKIIHKTKWSSKLFWHGFCMVLAWFVFFGPISLIARFTKEFIPAWFKFHWRLGVMGVMLVIIGGILIFTEIGTFNANIHSIIGIILFSLIGLQVILGYFSNLLWFPGKPPHWLHDKLHWYVGRIVIVTGFINILLGVDQYSSQSMSFILSMLIIVWFACSFAYFENNVGQKHEYEFLSSDEEQTPRDLQLNIRYSIVWYLLTILFATCVAFLI